MALGAGVTVGVIVAVVGRSWVSEIWYCTAVAVPTKFGNGSKVTVPFEFTV
ncbi:unannotated protein [freshwater metagenome]|uniref:Unannotated protein n=1 Tax=freshwater metagenome TaxID=449393 RepID=A0A6J6DB79_9ZZZZ